MSKKWEEEFVGHITVWGNEFGLSEALQRLLQKYIPEYPDNTVMIKARKGAILIEKVKI